MSRRERPQWSTRGVLTSVCSVLCLASTVAAQSQADVIAIEKTSNASLLWGPYRPNLYFGVRPRVPNSLLTGLLWARVEDYHSVQENFRHTCEQHSGMAGYGWEKYDPRHGGVQTIHDAGNQIDITTSFAKSADGQNWGVRIRGVPRPDAPSDLKTAIVFYATVEGQGLSSISVDGQEEEQNSLGYDGDVVMEGENPSIGAFKIVVKGDTTTGAKSNKHPIHGHASAGEAPLERTFVRSAALPEEALWQAKPVVFSAMKERIDGFIAKYTEENLPPPFQLYTIKHDPGTGNMQMVQKVFEGAFEFDVLFSSKSASTEFSSVDLEKSLTSAIGSFNEHFKELFQPKAPFDDIQHVAFSESLFSNLLGGIGYFYGDWKVDRSDADEYSEDNEGFWQDAAEARARNAPSTEGPSELFTSIPSRPFFPRGFLWDEGFHLIPVLDWDVDLTLQIVKSWFNLMDEDGWIAREQILGAEARSKVPPEFQVQYPHYANPPTLFFILTDLIEKLEAARDGKNIPTDPKGEYYPQLRNQASARQYLKELYPLLKRHYNWFRNTQKGDLQTYDRTAFSSREGYRWRGRTPQHILTSGLDDYPRAQPPHPGELHVDAISWVGAMARSLKKIASYLDEKEDLDKFAKQEEAITRNIADLHWSEAEGIHCDATIDEFEENNLVCHKGYISLFPFMLGLLDPTKDSGKIGKILTTIADPDLLWSEYGVRSLSKADENYGTAENYWRSPVWINMNYLILNRLLSLAQTSNPNQERAKSMYTDLRQNLVKTVYNSWRETGFAWEQYNPETGAGQRTQHFTGWTSLIVKVLAMPDLSAGGKHAPIDESHGRREAERDEL